MTHTIALIAAGLAVLIGVTIAATNIPFDQGHSGQSYYELLTEDARRHLPHLSQGTQQ